MLTIDKNIKKEGLALVTPLSHEVQALEVKTAEDYLSADDLLSRVRTARRKWTLRIGVVLDPMKDAVTAAKKAYEAGKALHTEVDAPLAAMEIGLKEAMREFKLEEQKQLQAAEEEREKEKQRLLAEAEKKKTAEAKAKTNPMRQKLAEARQALEQEAEEIEEQKAPAAVKGGASTSRKVKRMRIVNQTLLVGSLPLLPQDVVSINHDRLFKHLLGNPDLDPASIGCEIYDDIQIAGR